MTDPVIPKSFGGAIIAARAAVSQAADSLEFEAVRLSRDGCLDEAAWVRAVIETMRDLVEESR